MKYILFAIAIMLILFSDYSKERTIKPLKPKDHILAFGDSLTYGYNAKQSESYPSVLAKLSGYTIINEGVLGDTSKDGLRRLPKLLKEEEFKLIILLFGGNDIIQGLSREDLKRNLKSMIAMAKKKNIDVLLISIPDFGLFGLSPLRLYDEVAKEENVVLLSGLMAGILEDPSLKSDQIHPNAKGYKKMGEKIYERLKKEGWLNHKAIPKN